MAVPPHHFDDDIGDTAPGGLLGELERRQDDVLAQLDDLDAKLSYVLKGLEPSGDTDAERNAALPESESPIAAPRSSNDPTGLAEKDTGSTTSDSGNAKFSGNDLADTLSDEDDLPASAEDWA